jgi:diguanylate cyclase (GGDEF)-like protein/PAS domain S-box-containing protein
MAADIARAGRAPKDSNGSSHEAPGHYVSGSDEDRNSVEAILALLEASHKESAVFAISENAVVVPVPQSLDLHGQALAAIPVGHTSLDIVKPEYRVAVIEAWERVRNGTHAQTQVRLAENPDRVVILDFFDARRHHGVYVGLFTVADLGEDDARVAVKLPDLAPRLSHVRKDELAILLEVDEVFTEILGWSPEEVVGKRALELVHPDDHEPAVDNWVDMLAAPGLSRRVRLRHLHRDGSWVWLKVTNHNLLQDPEYGCVVAEMLDISEEMATHQALRAREQLLDRLAETVPVGFLQVDAASHVVYTNDRFHAIVGVERADEVEEQLSTVIAADRGLVTEAFESVLRTGSDANIEVRVQLPGENGKGVRYCSLNMRPLTDEVGEVTGAIVCVDNVTESVKAREELRARATFDTVTHCFNRPSTISALEAMISSDDRRGGPAAIFVDLDRFKDINDTFGHAAGDDFLRIVAERLQRSVRGEDVVGRIGGDEFLILCPGISSPVEAMRTASRLASALSYPIQIEGASAPSRASIGVAWSDAPVTTVEKLISEADAAMYVSKRAGDGEPVLFDKSASGAENARPGHWPTISETAS